jgi:hypothetical protein
MKLILDINNNYILPKEELLFFIYSDAAFSEKELSIKLIVNRDNYCQLNLSWGKDNNLSVIGIVPQNVSESLKHIAFDKRMDESIKKRYSTNLEDTAISILGLNFIDKQENIFIDFPISHLKTKFESIAEKQMADLLNSIMAWADNLMMSHNQRKS